MGDAQWEQAMARANQLVGNGKFDDAISLLDQLIAHDPHNLETYRLLAVTAEQKKGDIPKAINTYLLWAAECENQGMHDEALKLYNQVLAVETLAANPEKRALFKNSSPEKIRELIAQHRPEISLVMAQICLNKKQADEAIKHLRGAIDSSGGHQDHRVHTLLGIAYMQKNMDKEAIGEFQEVVRIAPNEAAYAYEKLGEIFQRAGKPTASTIVWFRNAGDLYLRNEQFEPAVRAYETILSFEPRNKDVLQRLAEIYTQQGMRDRALTTWRTLAQIYTEEGLLDKVIILYERLTDMNPDDVESWERLLEIYRGILQRDPSNLSVRLKLIKHLSLRGGDDLVIPEYMALASAYFEKGVLDEAYGAVQRVLEIDVNNPKAREMMGDIHMRREDPEQALSEYLMVVKIYSDLGDEAQRLEFHQKLVSLFPDDSSVGYEIAMSLREKGSHEEALAEILKVIEQQPDHVDAMTVASDLMLTVGRLDEACLLMSRIVDMQPHRLDMRMRIFELDLDRGLVDVARDSAATIVAGLREAGDLAGAERVYRRLLAYYPDSDELRQEICALRLEMGDVDSVVREYLLLANMFVRQQLLERAAQMYAAILSHRPDSLTAHHRLGRVLARQGQTSQALGHYAHLVGEYMRRNLIAQALDVLRESVDLAPDSIELRQRLAELLVRQLRIEEATEQYKRMIRAHLENKHVEAATGCVRDVISLQPLNLDLRMELATLFLEFNHLEPGQALLEELVTAYNARGQRDRVIDIYDRMAHIYRVQDRWDLYWEARERTAEIYAREGRNGEALAEYQEIIEGALRAGNRARADAIFPALADLYFSEGRVDDGVRAFERMAEVFARDGNSHEAAVAQEYMLGLLERKGDSGQARDLLVKMAERSEEAGDIEVAVTLFGRLYQTHVASGDVQAAVDAQFKRMFIVLSGARKSSTGDSQAAVDRVREMFVELQGLRTQHPSDRTRFADLFYELDYYADALPMFEELVANDASNVDARTRLAVIFARQGDMVAAAAHARSLIAGGRLDQILAEFARSASRDADGDVQMSFGAFYEEMGFYEEALREYQRAARSSSHRMTALNRMAFLFRRAGYVDLAIRQFMRTLEQPGYDDEELLETRYNLASLYHDAARYPEALGMFTECSAVRLRYRDVAERIDEINALIAAGPAVRADVIPFAAPREAPAAGPVMDDAGDDFFLEGPPPDVTDARE